jgi:PleD family two-component response regulator
VDALRSPRANQLADQPGDESRDHDQHGDEDRERKPAGDAEVVAGEERGTGPLARGVRLCDNRLVLSVVVVDDHDGFRRAARAFLELEGFSVVGEADDGSSALTVTRELRPELVLLDVALPDASGFNIAQQLAADRSLVILERR